jgi:amidohydrolase
LKLISRDPTFHQRLVDIRRDLHANPETAFEEYRTTEKIITILSSLNIEAHALPDATGAVALIRGPVPGQVLGLRADIDALPVHELNDVTYASRIPNKMHACGHDANTTIMLGVAEKMIHTGLVSRMKGCVKFLFQPAEERLSGAKVMIERGVLENPKVDRIIAGHMSPDLPVGNVGICKNIAYASSDRFRLTIHGKGGHGGRPEDCVDPINAGAYFHTQIQSIVGRNIRATESAVITVGTFNAGTAANVIPDTAVLEGTIRALSTEVRQIVIERLEDLVSGLEKTFRVQCDWHFRDGVPVLYNDENVAKSLYEASSKVLGPNHVSYLSPVMGSEDFSLYTLECPSAIMRIGCRNEHKGIVHPLHSPYFDIDEDALSIGVDIFYEAIRDYLA